MGIKKPNQTKPNPELLSRSFERQAFVTFQMHWEAQDFVIVKGKNHPKAKVIEQRGEFILMQFLLWNHFYASVNLERLLS